MGSFSFLRAEKLTERANLTWGDRYKILIPKEFGGGSIEDTYFDYGYVFYNTDHEADLYGILAYWNKCEGMEYDGDTYPSTMKDILERGKTSSRKNREKGIEIGCWDKDMAKLKYPFKFVSLSYSGTYEDCKGRSYGDPNQGFYKEYWEDIEENYENLAKYTKDFEKKGENVCL